MGEIKVHRLWKRLKESKKTMETSDDACNTKVLGEIERLN